MATRRARVHTTFGERLSTESAIRTKTHETLTVSRFVAVITHKGYSGSVISVIAKKPTGSSRRCTPKYSIPLTSSRTRNDICHKYRYPALRQRTVRASTRGARARTSPCTHASDQWPMAMPFNVCSTYSDCPTSCACAAPHGAHATLGLMGTCERARAADSLARCALATHCLSSAISSSMLR